MRFFIVCLVLVFSNQAFASPKCEKALSLKIGDTVPCAEGVLFPPGWALEATRLKTVRVPELENELTLLKRTTTITIESLTLELELERRHSRNQSDLLDRAIGIAKPDPWWKHPGLWVAVGVVVGASTTVAVTYAVNSD